MASTSVKDLTAFAVDVLGIPIRVGLSRNPLKTDEEHVKAKLATFAASVHAVQGVTTLTRFAVPGQPNIVRLLAEEVFEEMYIIPYIEDRQWTGPVVDRVGGFAMTSPPEAVSASGRSPFGTGASRVKSGHSNSRSKGSSDLTSVRTLRPSRCYRVCCGHRFNPLSARRPRRRQYTLTLFCHRTCIRQCSST